MPEKKWSFAILDNADAVTEFLNQTEYDPLYVHVAIADHDKFYVFYYA